MMNVIFITSKWMFFFNNLKKVNLIKSIPGKNIIKKISSGNNNRELLYDLINKHENINDIKYVPLFPIKHLFLKFK